MIFPEMPLSCGSHGGDGGRTRVLMEAKGVMLEYDANIVGVGGADLI